MIRLFKNLRRGVAIALIGLVPSSALASSHMDAPLITLDPAANTTDVYAFVQQREGAKYLITALGLYPHQEPGIGPNKYNFDDDALYEIHISTGNDVAAGRATFSYQFEFSTRFKNNNTILQSYLGVVEDIDDAAQNLTQTYTVKRVESNGRETSLGTGVVPPNNQGKATPFYNQGDNGENPAKDGVADESQLDRYTQQAISTLNRGYISFAGQRDDGFYGDIQSIFDLLRVRSSGKDSQGGFNLHMIALAIPVSEIGGDMQMVGVYATVSRQRVRILNEKKVKNKGEFVQVARQGNPLFNEALVGLADKDLYSRTTPARDKELFADYATNPELAKLINTLIFTSPIAPETNRTDLAAIFIPDMIKVDLSTTPCRLAGGGPSHPTNPDDPGFSRLSIFGNDVLLSQVQAGFGGGVIPGGWPNGRRFGDDVVDIALTALISDLRTSPPVLRGPAGDGVNANDAVFNKVFPYESTPKNGRNHSHP